MQLSQAEGDLKKRVGPLETLTPRRALEAMFVFYADLRADDVEIDEDGDMLLYEWGTSITTGETFQIGITRQFIYPDEEDEEPYQLHLTLYFDPTDALRQLKDGNKWCHSPDKLPAFRKSVEKSAAFKAVADAKPLRVDLYLDQC